MVFFYTSQLIFLTHEAHGGILSGWKGYWRVCGVQVGLSTYLSVSSRDFSIILVPGPGG